MHRAVRTVRVSVCFYLSLLVSQLFYFSVLHSQHSAHQCCNTSSLLSLPFSLSPPSSLSLSCDRLLGVGSCSGCLYVYVVRSGSTDVAQLYPHANIALALRPLPFSRAVLAAAGAVAAALAALAYALGVPLQDVASVVLLGEGKPGAPGNFAL